MKKIYLIISICGIIGFANRLYSQATPMPSGVGSGSINQCGGTFTDDGGGGNYSNNQNSFFTICPTVPGQFVSLNFTAFATQNNVDYLVIFNGNTSADAVIGIYSGATSPGTITSSSPSGCLSFRFFSNGLTTGTGWSANVSCVGAPGPAPTATPRDCGGGQGITICSNSAFAGNSSGVGTIDELEFGNTLASANTPPWQGCLATGEHQSSWYYFSPSASGTIAFVINPTNGIDDYDFAIWGPSLTDVPCPLYTGLPPIRCSYADGALMPPATGLVAGNTDLSEGSGPFGGPPAGINGLVAPLVVVAGQIYAMCIDNFTASGSPFTLTFTLTGGASLDCTPLPIVLQNFDGKAQADNNMVYWTTATEINNSYFTIEKSEDAISWSVLGRHEGAGNSNILNNYTMIDPVPFKITYYRLSQTDYNGETKTFSTIVVNREQGSATGHVFGFYPNPVSDVVNVQTFGDGDNILTIRDQAGKTIFNTIISGKTIQPVSLDPSIGGGLYFITVENQGHVQNEKIIILKK